MKTLPASKSLYIALILSLFSAAIALMLAGCGVMSPVRSQTVTLRPAETNTASVVAEQFVVVTNTVLTTTATSNGKTNVVASPFVATNIVRTTNFVVTITPPVTYQSNYIAPTWFAATETLGTITPAPYGHAVATGLLALTATFLGWMNRRNAAKALATLTALDEAKIVGNTLVDNFETLRRAALTIPAYETIDHKVMDIVKAAQSLSGAKKTIAAIVDERTVNTL